MPERKLVGNLTADGKKPQVSQNRIMCEAVPQNMLVLMFYHEA